MRVKFFLLVVLSVTIFAVSCNRSNNDSAQLGSSKFTNIAKTPASFSQCKPLVSSSGKKQKNEKQESQSLSNSIKKIFVIVLENTNYETALKLPFMSNFAKTGALLENFSAITHPSQPNYIALTAGNTYVVDNNAASLDVRHIGDLLEDAGKTWKLYADGYPGDCNLSEWSGYYVRKHVPFLSFRNIQTNPSRCAHIVNHCELLRDIEKEQMPNFAMFIPDNYNNGHDAGSTVADNWLTNEFGPLLQDPRFTKDTLFVILFDEDDATNASNHIYAALNGSGVVPGSSSNEPYNHYSMLRTFEHLLGLGSLGLEDAKAKVISGIWKK